MSRPYDSADGSSDSSADTRPPAPPKCRLWLGITALAVAGFGLLLTLSAVSVDLYIKASGSALNGTGAGLLLSFTEFILLMTTPFVLLVAGVFSLVGVCRARERGRRLSIYAAVLTGIELTALLILVPELPVLLFAYYSGIH